MATATYSDNTSYDVSDSLTWTSNELSTVTMTPTGWLSGVAVGSTTVTTAEDGGITTHTIDVNVFTCRVTGSSCLESFDTGSRKMFINSPSKIFLNSLGGENIGFTKKGVKRVI